MIKQHLVADRQKFFVGERDEPPVVLPCVVEDGAHGFEIAIAVLAIDRTDHHASFQATLDCRHHGGNFEVGIHLVGEQILGGVVAGLLRTRCRRTEGSGPS